MLAPLFVVTLGLCYCSTENDQSFMRPHLSGPSEALVKGIAEFECEPPTHWNDTILLKLFRKGTPDRWMGDSTSLDGEPGSFTIQIRPYHEGYLECVASLQNNSFIEPIVSNTHYLKVIDPVKGAKILVRSGPAEFFEGHELGLVCDLTAGNDVSYKWWLNGRLLSPSPHLRLSDNGLLIKRTTPEDSGSYKCVATNFFNKTAMNSSSPAVVITVKELVSDPDVSFTVVKEDSHYSALVTCLWTKGTPPVNVSLYNTTGMVASMSSEERSATFKVPLVLDQHSGIFQCQARNADQTAHSVWMPLEVVSVGGPVTIRYDYDIGENFAVVGLRVYCNAAKGSHLRYQWFLNKTLLHGQGSFYYVVNQPSEGQVLLLSVGRSSAGTYHCEASNSFDNSTAIHSKARYLDREVLNRLPTYVVVIVFGCFTILILMVLVCCGFGVVYRRRWYGEKPLSGLQMETMMPGGELDETEYNEDAGVVRAAREDEYDQASEASADEWPQISEWKETLEDESVESVKL